MSAAGASTPVVLTSALCEEALGLGLRFLLSCQQEDGGLSYEIPLAPGRAPDGRHQVREAGGVWGLALYLHRSNLPPRHREAVWVALERSLAWLQERSLCVRGLRWPIPPDASSGFLGTASLYGLALVEMLAQSDCPDPDGKRELLQELLAFLLSCRSARGRFHARYRLDDGTPFRDPSPYFDGESLLLLSRAARLPGFAPYALAASVAGDAMFEAYAQPALQRREVSDNCKGFYQWGSMAFTELYLFQPGESRWIERTLAMADWILDVHKVLNRQRNTGYAFEGLVSAYRLARFAGNAPATLKLRAAIETGLGRLCTWQLGSCVQCAQLQAVLPRNPRALGGVLGGLQDTLLRIDTTQHQMHALLLAERHLGWGAP